jgi:single-stranded-DNA-specific exonuclease
MIPDRLIDGYGLSKSSVDKIIALKPSLLITVDCGIASRQEIDDLSNNGIKVIVTDHHECQGSLPNAFAVINPKIPDCIYPFSGLAGAGVALKLVQALDSLRGTPDEWQQEIALAALGTVADVVPMIDENRKIVSAGLAAINNESKSVPCGLGSLIDMCQKKGRMTSTTLGFTLAPRINAAGRLGDAAPAMRLLLGENIDQAVQDAEKLNELNRQRQVLESSILDEAIAQINEKNDFANRHILIVANNNWHPGVVGIVCSRLVELYSKPAIVLAGENGENLRGSCRTYGEFSILEAIEAAADYTITYGGHCKAAGIELTWQQLPDFERVINEYAKIHCADSGRRPALTADMKINEELLTISQAKSVELLEPFGEGNPRPLFVADGFTIVQWKLVGNGRHVKLQISGNNGKIYDAIAFGMSDADELFNIGDRIDLLFSLEINIWQNRETLQLQIKDLKHSDQGLEFFDRPWLLDNLYNELWTIPDLADYYKRPYSDFIPGKSEYKAVYQYIKSRFEGGCIEFDLKILCRRIAGSYRLDLTVFKLTRILQIFAECGLIEIQWLEQGRCRMNMNQIQDKVKLELAPTYQRLNIERNQE